ncbi:hypothetical protein Ddye_015434 [Dipteronia dyeriana]|uniref:Secreted protein n=1 Tax=Dipteronia dyeriana TaxID=168575 RepID=A0AAD9U4T2_9ROSI|nr:hypothetical protein Ddye_015434 [Dipteronia dyeriana]
MEMALVVFVWSCGLLCSLFLLSPPLSFLAQEVHPKTKLLRPTPTPITVEDAGRVVVQAVVEVVVHSFHISYHFFMYTQTTKTLMLLRISSKLSLLSCGI